jgi:hypothetical protein
MNVNRFLFFGLLVGSAISAHSFDHLEIEVLRKLALEQHEKLALKEKIIAAQSGIIGALEEEVHHLKHEVRKESRYHELKKILKALGF